jgi:hypothetical protein
MLCHTPSGVVTTSVQAWTLVRRALRVELSCHEDVPVDYTVPTRFGILGLRPGQATFLINPLNALGNICTSSFKIRKTLHSARSVSLCSV